MLLQSFSCKLIRVLHGYVGAVLEQGGHVIAYASQTLIKSESNYSVIQKENLAAVLGMKQFRHYPLGRPFTLMTDHASLQWLCAQKWKGSSTVGP